ncbi:dTDP-4-dehydrorhamnose reductase [Pullulanibacillus sp. KACC 23026]|uniref:dTDP-4-dehydrorhamnose reductase n=1 Tax=Pullulanibacillus sp. KACC 23026 TaxID=3028315 RepID=UPI0023B07BE6|nr:dTDP-4-dehydrorhamnose reductase [Pullulanibacillus sp. KACC 23026]WEG13164.1 dTDP-4-dehydrorhamnose reductase [Pullulanibacillus sp. KACC 23026]
MAKVLVTGAKGQLGQDVVRLFTEAGHEVIGLGREDLDITNSNDVWRCLEALRPEVVIHSAAYTAVDQAESDVEGAFLVNAYGTRNMAAASEAVEAKLVYMSTDYVFNGESDQPYNEFEATSPLGVYGKSKHAGEQFVRELHSRFFIARTSWVFGAHGGNFVKTMLRLAETQPQLKVVHDQRGCPTYTVDLANCLLKMIETSQFGTYHVSNSGVCTWYEFAKTIFEKKGISIDVVPVTTEEFPRPARRPKNSAFDHMALRLNGFEELPDWQNALDRFLDEVK